MLAIGCVQPKNPVITRPEAAPAAAPILESEPELLTPKHLARMLGLSEPTIRAMCADSTLPAFKIGSRWFVAKRDLVQMIGGDRRG